MHKTISYTGYSSLQAGHFVQPKKQSYKGKIWTIIAAFSIIRLLFANLIEIGNDEAYYWLYMQKLQWSYFDHPSMVALWGRIFTLNLLLDDHEMFVRLGSIVACALATWCIYKATATVHSKKAGLFAAILYNTCFYSGVLAGLLIMPDSPQMLFFTFCMWMLARISKDPHIWQSWILFGISAGLCIMSKVHGAFLWIGLGTFILFTHRNWFKLPQLYAAALLTLILSSPILIWNIINDFATYKLHSKRVTVGGSFNLDHFYNEVLGQVLFNNPVNVLLTVVALISLRRSYKKVTAFSIFQWIGIPLALILLFVALFKPVFPHWSGPAYVALTPIAAAYLSKLRLKNFYPKWIKLSVIAFAILLPGWTAVIHLYPGTVGAANLSFLGKGDASLDRFGWEKAGKEFSTFYQQQVNSKTISNNAPVVIHYWWGAHIEYYFCRPANVIVIGLGEMKGINHYYWLNEERKDKVDMSAAFAIVASDEYYDAPKYYSAYYDNIQLVKTIDLTRGGQKAKSFFIYKLSDWKGEVPYAKN